MILGCCTNHRRAADVDVFNGLVNGRVISSYRLFERIQIDDQQIDGLDPAKTRTRSMRLIESLPGVEGLDLNDEERFVGCILGLLARERADVLEGEGLSVEVDNTDAEGRLVLGDALTKAAEAKPDLIIDFATLTGAARIALGADLPPLFSNRDEVAQGIQQAGDEVEDPLWTMPLYRPYRKQIESPIADLNNIGKSSYGGCITAALFLEHFVTEETDWVHIDTFGWNQTTRPGRPVGGEALGLRASFSYLKKRYG